MWSLTLILIWVTVLCTLANNFEKCTFKRDKYECTPASRAELLKLGMPHAACHNHDCGNCIRVWKTFIAHNNKLLLPKAFYFQQEADVHGTDTIIDCKRDGFPCTCSENSPCSGTVEYCRRTGCTNASQAMCSCRLVPAVTTLVHEADGEKIVNPMLVSYQVCVAKPQRNLPSRHHQRRHLLMDEEAVFQRNDLRITYNDPVLTLSHPGTLVVRIGGIERVITVKEPPFQTTLPPEMLEWTAEMHLIFVTTDGQTLRGTVQIKGRTVCNPLQCILCTDLLRQLKCLPKTVTYVVYALLVILSAIAFIYAKTVVICVWKCLYTVACALYKIYRFIRGSTLVAVKTGAITGNALRNRMQVINEYVERHIARPVVQAPLPGLAILTLMLIVDGASAECNAHSIITSDVKACTDAGTEGSCRMTTNAQVTLMNLEHQSCLWFTDKEKLNTLFSVKVTFQQAKCDWLTARDYFTHVTSMRYVNQVVCANHPTWNGGKGCTRDQTFEALTRESLDWPGITRCQPSDSGSTKCWIIDSQHCIYYRIWLEADFLRAYEVRRILAMQCSYQLLIEHEGNNTAEVIAVRNQAVTSTGIKISVSGALDQPMQMPHTHLISRVGNPEESYLDRASLPSRPQKGHIGDTQANDSMSKNFIFDEDMFKCTFYEDLMRCQRQQSYLLTMVRTGKNALPFTSAWHHFKVDKEGKLTSEMLHSAPLIVNLEFENYEYKLETRTVCPKFANGEIETAGCYACEPLATIKFQAFSSCAAGIVDVIFEALSVHTRSVRLNTEKSEITIKFKSESRCAKEKMCLKARTVTTCKLLDFCLEKPSIALTHPNMTYSTWHAGSPSLGWDAFGLPTGWNLSVTGVAKWLTGILSIIVMVLFMVSTILTCCHR